MPTPDAYPRAAARARRRLYKQGAISLLLALFLAGLNWVTFRGRWWLWWPLAGLALLWGLAAMRVYNHRHFETLQQRLLQEEQDKDERLRETMDD